MGWLAYAHPIFGAVVVGFVFILGHFGLRGRGSSLRCREARQLHARLGPWVCAAALLAHAGGVLMVWSVRSDLTAASSVHFRSGTLLVCLLLLLFCSRPFMHLVLVRQLHPWVGALTMLIAAAHVFFGMQLIR
ncbi:hypothetical protein HRbin30_01228 [bacterium HR30]|nr:hypothetical protein HRbin30_01228 [bacterium HR30]